MLLGFQAVAELAQGLAGESSRLKKRAAIAASLLAAHQDQPEDDTQQPGSNDAGLLALYLSGAPFAEADARRLNVGGALLSRALQHVAGASEAQLSAAYRRHGDLGEAAADLLALKPGPAPSITLVQLRDSFAAMAVAKTTAIRSATVVTLLERATPLEAKYLLKLMLGDMRIGVKQSLIEEALAVAAAVDVAAVRNAVMLEADLSLAVKQAFAGTLQTARMRLFHPLGFMLASPVETPEAAVERFAPTLAKGPAKGELAREASSVGTTPNPGELEEPERGALPDQLSHIEAFLEDKYDGMRAQLHFGLDAEGRTRAALYSRSREEITASFPELEEAFTSAGAVAGNVILDGEILGWEFALGQALPFAVMGQRIGRKQVSGELMRQIPAVFMAFDLLYADGELLLDRPLRERRHRLEQMVERLGPLPTPTTSVEERRARQQTQLFSTAGETGTSNEELRPRLMLSPARFVESAEAIELAYKDARLRANEGVMIKAAASAYQPGRRGLAWVKLKRELATLDVVVTGAEFGHGRRAGILSDYTFAVRAADGALLNVGKAYSGLTDAEIAAMSAWCMDHTLDHDPHGSGGHFRTVEPLRVLEVAFNNIMRSDRHASGFALRFPRIIRIRDDKLVSEIDTVEAVEAIYQSQVDKPAEA